MNLSAKMMVKQPKIPHSTAVKPSSFLIRQTNNRSIP
jgi:hypothetical protein